MSQSKISVANRLAWEYERMSSDLMPGILAKPLDDDLFTCCFVICGTRGTPFEGGVYYGEMKIGSTFPIHVPRIVVLTPNGRFRTGWPLCLTFTHRRWDPTFTLATYLNSFSSYMMQGGDMMPGYYTTPDRFRVNEIRSKASSSMDYNLTNENFMKLFGNEPFTLKAKGLPVLDENIVERGPRLLTDDYDEDEESELSSYSPSDDEALDGGWDFITGERKADCNKKKTNE